MNAPSLTSPTMAPWQRRCQRGGAKRGGAEGRCQRGGARGAVPEGRCQRGGARGAVPKGRGGPGGAIQRELAKIGGSRPPLSRDMMSQHDHRFRSRSRSLGPMPRRLRARGGRANGADNPGVEAAFAKVPREAFLGPPPWRIGSGGTSSWASTSDPKSLYQDRLVALNRAKGINNGQPSLHALCISAVAPDQAGSRSARWRGCRLLHRDPGRIGWIGGGLRDRTRPRGTSGR